MKGKVIILSIIKNRIKEYRAKNGFNQNQLGIILGVTKNTISCWEQGDFDPSLINICKMCDIFDCSFEDLFEYSPNLNYDKLRKQIIVKEGVDYGRVFASQNM